MKTESREWSVAVASDPLCLHYGRALAQQFEVSMEVDCTWDERHLAKYRGFWVEEDLCKGGWSGQETEEEYAIRACDRLDEIADCTERGRLVVVSREVMEAVVREEKGLVLACLEYSDRPRVRFSRKSDDFPYQQSTQIAIISVPASQYTAEIHANYFIHQPFIQSQPWTVVYSPDPKNNPLAQAVSRSLGIDLKEMAALRPWERGTESERECEERLQAGISQLRGTEIIAVDASICQKMTGQVSGIAILSDNQQLTIVDLAAFAIPSAPSITLICNTDIPTAVMSTLLGEKFPSMSATSWDLLSCSSPACVALAQSIANQYGLVCTVDYLWDDQHVTESPEPDRSESIVYNGEWFGREDLDQFKARMETAKGLYTNPLIVCVDKQVFFTLTGTTDSVATLHMSPSYEWTVKTEITLGETREALAVHYAGIIIQQVAASLNSAISTSDSAQIYKELEKALSSELATLLSTLENKYDAAIMDANRNLQAEIGNLRTEMERRNEEMGNIVEVLKGNLSDYLENVGKFDVFNTSESVKDWEGRLQSLENRFEVLIREFERFNHLLPSSELPLTIDKVEENWEISTQNHHLYRIEDAELWAECEGIEAQKLLECISLGPGISTHIVPFLSSFSSYKTVKLAWKQRLSPLSPPIPIQFIPRSAS